MSRNKYDEGLGVARIRWTSGEPEERPYGSVLVEAWSSSISLREPSKARAKVAARVELRRFRDGKWHSLSFGGEWAPSGNGAVRRHAYLPSRNWNTTITIDGWGANS